MIEMAKKLNMNPEADVEGQMAQEEFPEADEAAFDEGEEQEEAPIQEAQVADEEAESAEGLAEVEEESIEEDKKINPFGKTEMAILYSDLMKGMKTLKKFGGDPKRPRKTVNIKGTKVTEDYHNFRANKQLKPEESKEWKDKKVAPKKVDKKEKPYWRKELEQRDAKRKRQAKPKKTSSKKPLDEALEAVERKMKVKKEVTSKKK